MFMRGFQCHYYLKDKDGNLTNKHEWINPFNKLVQNFVISQACWSSISRIPAGSFIYIDNYKTEKTKNDIKFLIDLINEITPCSIVKIKNKDYIEYKLLETYDQNLILLNFIRNLWNHPGVSHTEGAQEPPLPNYIDIFFDELKKSEYKDPLQKLTDANKKACVDYRECNYGLGHSNVHTAKDLTIKDSKSLLKFESSSTRLFLTT